MSRRRRAIVAAAIAVALVAWAAAAQPPASTGVAPPVGEGSAAAPASGDAAAPASGDDGSSTSSARPSAPSGEAAPASAAAVAEAAPPPRTVPEDEAPPAYAERTTRPGFVTVRGTRFERDGEPFAFVGANVAVMHGPVHRAEMEATLDAAAADGLGVVRLWALGEYAADAPDWADEYAFRRGPDTWLPAALDHLDRTLEACRARGLHAIVSLSNRWGDYGGLGAYLRWALVPFTADPGGAVSRRDLSRFYQSAEARTLYRAHVARIVGRTNARTGVAYRDDPTILAWELANELEASRRDAPALVRWVQAQAAYVRSLDPDHLVSAGHTGYASSFDRRTWLDVARARGIDYADAHAYPTRYEEVRTTRELSRWIDDRVQLAHHVAGRPIVFGEVGFSARERTVLGVARQRWLDAFLRGAARDGASGVLAWVYVPDGEHVSEHGILTTGERVRQTGDLRRVLSRHARRWARAAPEERNPRLGDEVGTAMLWDSRETLRGEGGVHADWGRAAEGGDWTMAFSPLELDRALVDSGGIARHAAIVHLWANGEGWVRYRIRAPRGVRAPPASLFISLRASAEVPGAGGSLDDVSSLLVSIDGELAGAIELPPDDGIGRVVSLEITSEAALAALARRGEHVLELALVPDALGACLYAGIGDLEAASSLELATRAELPGRIELVWREPSASE